jgi:hypothetical protein
VYGSQFLNSGFDFLNLVEEPPGPKSISVLFKSTITGEFTARRSVRSASSPARPFGAIETPDQNASVSGGSCLPDGSLTMWCARKPVRLSQRRAG